MTLLDLLAIQGMQKKNPFICFIQFLHSIPIHGSGQVKFMGGKKCFIWIPGKKFYTKTYFEMNKLIL
jgi:hypothetical protein